MEELARLVLASNPKANALRTNVQKDAPMRTLPNGRTILARPIQSQALRSGPIFDAVKKMHPWATQVTVNKKSPVRHTGMHRERARDEALGLSGAALFTCPSR